MIRSRRFVVAAIATVFILSIAAPTERALAQTTTAEVQEDVSGVWSGRRSYMGFSTEISFDIKQTGEKIQGVAQWGLSPSGLGGTGGPVEGTRSGKTIKLQVSSEGFQGELELSGDEMRGSWVGPYPYEIVLRRQK